MPAAWAAAVGAAVSVAGTVAGGIAKSNQSDYQAKVADLNAQIENQNADYAEQAGTIQQYNKSMENRGAAGRLKANQAAAGIDVNSGSALAVQQSQRETGLQDVATIGSNTARTVYGYRNQAVAQIAQSGLEQQEADTAIPGAALGAAGGFLGSSEGQSLSGSLFGSFNSPTIPVSGAG